MLQLDHEFYYIRTIRFPVQALNVKFSQLLVAEPRYMVFVKINILKTGQCIQKLFQEQSKILRSFERQLQICAYSFAITFKRSAFLVKLHRKVHYWYFLFNLPTLQEQLLRIHTEKKQFQKLMYIFLLKVYYFSFLAIASGTFN